MGYDLEYNDKKYLELKSKILKSVMIVGMAATFVGGVYNATNGYQGMPVYVHVAGFVLLLVLLLLFRKVDKTRIAVIVFVYFCFVYTPFAWHTLGGLYSSMAYVVYVFFLLISILLDGRANLFFTLAYLVEIVGLVVTNGFNHIESPQEPFFPKAFSYLIMLSILVFVTRIYKKQYTDFLLKHRRDSITDILTGLHNHRYLTDTLTEMEEWYHGGPGRDYAVAVIDLDDFKMINDTYGHSTGDDVLHDLGILFADVFQGHMVGRYGGDEFVAIFQNLPMKKCIAICEGLMEHVRSNKFTDQKIDIRLSIGLCSRSQIQGRDVFAEADMLLYQAKSQEKNRLCVRAT